MKPEEVRRRIEGCKEKRLTELDLSNGWNTLGEEKLTAIPCEIFDCVWLEKLDLSYNQLSELPDSIFLLQNLSGIDLSFNQLREIPDSISLLQNLSNLYLNNNQLSELPDSITRLQNLSILDLSSNQLRELLNSISRLQNLSRLDLSSNQLSELPDSISLLQNLSVLDLSENPLVNPPIEIAKQGIEAIRTYFRYKVEEGEERLYEAKLIIIGEGGAGKTTLARKILDANASMPKAEETTKGIDVLEWHFLMDNGKDFRVNIWDFGGQEIYHTTHQFFLTKRSLYLLVVDSRKEHPHLDYWLNLIELFTEKSPLLIIKNAIGDRAVEVDDTQLRGRFANLKESFPSNLGKLEEDKRRSEFAKILNSIKYHIQDLPHIGTKLPKTWAKIRETLENDDHNYIPLAEYFTICDENGFKLNQEGTTDGRLVISQYLHDLGVILHFQTDKTSLLYRTVILKPQWGTDAVYKVLDNETVKQNKGRFTDNDLSSIWQDAKYNSMQGELLALMLEFKLCYRLPNAQNTYIAPQLLDFNKPQYSWNDQENLLLNYEYDFMPRGISTRFIVEMHRYIDEPKVWRSGVVLKRENTFAEVIETYDRREIKIRLSGSNKRGFLEVITDQLDEIHASFKQLKVKKLIPCNCDVCKGNLDPHFYDLGELRDRISHKKENIECKKPPYNEVNVLSLIDDIGNRDKLIASPKEYEQLATPTIINNFLSPIQKLNLQQSQQGNNTMTENHPKPQPPIKVKSAWANGSFYLVIFIVVVAGIGFLGSNLPFPVLCVVIIAGVLFVPIIGALQLKQDDRVKDETFLELMKLVIGQLPLIGNPLNKLLNPADKSKDQE